MKITCPLCFKEIGEFTELEILELEEGEEFICEPCHGKLVAEEKARIGKRLHRCHCGNFLYECLNKDEKRIGTTHLTSKDEDYCLDFWKNARVGTPEEVLDAIANSV